MSIKTYKGFDKDLKCRGFQYEIGKEYEEENASACNCGFHACEMPIEVLAYYEPGKQSRYCEVEQDGKLSRHSDDTKVASTKIKIGAEIGIPGLVKAQVEYVNERAEESNTHHSTGSWSANSATGYGSANISTGAKSSNAGMGDCNISVGWGKDNKSKGSVGSYLVLSEWGDWDGEKYPFIGAKMVMVDGKGIKADTWYTLQNGRAVKVADSND